jgi:homoserine kinase
MEANPMGMRTRPEPVDIVVPASVANLGPGLDTLAVALELYLHVRAQALPGLGKNELRFDFVGFELDGENFIERAFRFMTVRDSVDFPSLSLEVRSEIPSRSGLGSSAAATVAGLRLYEALFGPLPTQELLNVASELEGHPDNAAAALLGGLTTSCELEDGSVAAVSMPWPEAIRFVVLTPDLGLDTASSRRALPKRLGREEVVFNFQRIALLLQALQSRQYSLLREALRDRCHQPFRLVLVPGLEQLLELEHPDLLGVCLAGAGPSILALVEKNADAVRELLTRAYQPLGVPFTLRTLRAYQSGAWKLEESSLPAATPPLGKGLDSRSYIRPR